MLGGVCRLYVASSRKARGNPQGVLPYARYTDEKNEALTHEDTPAPTQPEGPLRAGHVDASESSRQPQLGALWGITAQHSSRSGIGQSPIPRAPRWTVDSH